MNEQIGLLAEQAGLLGPSSRVGNAHEATERFAMLIIDQCVQESLNASHREDDMGAIIARAIKRSFGVS